MSSESLPETIVTPKTREREQTRSRKFPPYHVILENDDLHTFEFVVDVLCKALGYPTPQSFQLTMQAHTSGRAVVWTGPREHAELKLEQIQTFHEIHPLTGAKLGPVGCTLEPAE